MQESAIKAAASFRPRKILTKHDAIEIYRMKHEHGFPTEHAASCFLAEKVQGELEGYSGYMERQDVAGQDASSACFQPSHLLRSACAVLPPPARSGAAK